MPRENSPTQRTPGAQTDLSLTPEELLELVQRGGRGLIVTTGVAGRTRRRILARRGTSLREIKRTARRRLAESLLASSLPLREIYRRLGYSSTQTLSRFIKREFGTTAVALREELRKG